MAQSTGLSPSGTVLKARTEKGVPLFPMIFLCQGTTDWPVSHISYHIISCISLNRDLRTELSVISDPLIYYFLLQLHRFLSAHTHFDVYVAIKVLYFYLLGIILYI